MRTTVEAPKKRVIRDMELAQSPPVSLESQVAKKPKPTNTNEDFISMIRSHRERYNPMMTWYEWQPRRTGRQQLSRQNDIAYSKMTKKIPGSHEHHIAEELHRYFENPTFYTDLKGTVKVNPSVPPMGDPYNFHGSKWTGKRFDDMWTYWTQLFPAHAHDIEIELAKSRSEERKAWWDVKHAIRSNDPSLKSTPPKERALVERRKGGHFEFTYLDNPCRICGAIDHPALRRVEDLYGVVSYSYVCQMAAVTDWESTCMRPCPEKMAKTCNNNIEEAQQAFSLMITEGWGQFQSNRMLRQFFQMVKYFCEQGHIGKESS